ncbi:hypothetical protein L227DRAFT_336058 [Lentinus tigrinus ALCF2SS1-6]|uniref:Uncharacterized protein n=1 Tax=Lentinus tigrinus ALCF2SS1-6 TaxID=1328759 RepID=A0A5C2RTA0_9APHY|nr:hypothetical protein L227DRAFT_336058 [Lentinus tigrinus ALCF2SS1-6]
MYMAMEGGSKEETIAGLLRPMGGSRLRQVLTRCFRVLLSSRARLWESCCAIPILSMLSNSGDAQLRRWTQKRHMSRRRWRSRSRHPRRGTAFCLARRSFHQCRLQLRELSPLPYVRPDCKILSIIAPGRTSQTALLARPEQSPHLNVQLRPSVAAASGRRAPMLRPLQMAFVDDVILVVCSQDNSLPIPFPLFVMSHIRAGNVPVSHFLFLLMPSTSAWTACFAASTILFNVQASTKLPQESRESRVGEARGSESYSATVFH